MGYEPRIGDMVRSTAPPCDGVVVEQASYGLWTIHDGKHRLGGYSIHGLTPLRPDTVGQRVRFTDGRPGGEEWRGTAERVGTGYTWTIARDSTDPLAKKNPHWFAHVENLVRIADNAAKVTKMLEGGTEIAVDLTKVPEVPARLMGEVRNPPKTYGPEPTFDDGWTPPQCGRPGHDPACLCSTGWVRQPEPEPEVREIWIKNRHVRPDGTTVYWAEMEPYAPGAERHYIVRGGPFRPTRELAIAAWRACR